MLRRRDVLKAAAAAAVATPLAAPMLRAQSGADGLAEGFLAATGLPGLSWAVQKADGARHLGAAGYADPAAGEGMTPDHRMRMASVSKTITAAMILQLEAEETLWTGHRPFAPDGIFRDWLATDLPWLPVLELITLDHLLTHTAGGWGNDGAADPFFRPDGMALGTEDLLRKALAEQAPDGMPGAAYLYSNFGYGLLGRVIEVATEVDCTASVWAWLADPVGAQSFALGGDTLADRLEGEAVYVGLTGHDPYALRISRLDSLGGWVATAADMVAIHAGFDGQGAETVASAVPLRMAEPGTPGGTYGRGLQVSPSHGNRWHHGRLPGTASLVVMLENGDVIGAIANGSTPEIGKEMETLIFDIWRAVG